MFETKANYEKALPLASAMLEGQGRKNLSHLLKQERIKNLFLYNVNHPMGYVDGPSSASPLELNEGSKELTDKDRLKLYEISERIIRTTEDDKGLATPEENSALLSAANQLVQTAGWNTHRPIWRNKLRGNLLEKISKTYVENPEQIGRLKEWDAQIAENKGFYHLMPSEMISIGALMSVVPSVIAASVFQDNELSNFFMNTLMPISLGSVGVSYVGHQLALVSQDIFGTEKSPNTASELQKKRHYAFQRHPLYSWKGMMSVVPGITSLNPVGLFFAAKGAYNISKGCEFQDERMRILHGKEAEEYQNKTPAFIPGSKMLLKGLGKILPENIVDALDSPVSKYLEKIPYVKSERYNMAECSKNPEYHKGEPTCHIYSDPERAVNRSSVLEDFAEIPGDVARLGKAAYGWGAKEVKKKLGKRQRRLDWEKRSALEKKAVSE